MDNELAMLRPAHVARLLGLTPGRVYQLIADGELPSVRVGGAIRVPRCAWDEWLRARGQEALESLSDAPEGETAGN